MQSLSETLELATAFTSVEIPTPHGCFAATFSEAGLARLAFPSDERIASPSAIVETPITLWLEQTAAALDRALRGLRPQQIPPLDLSRGTEFQRSVWSRLLQIPIGSTMTYRGLANAIGRPNAMRAVGQACGANPIPVLVPCHRVLASDGRLGGFSGGLNWKITLLRQEGVQKLFSTSISCRSRP